MALAAIAGIAAVSAIAQHYQAEKARAASKAELDKIARMYEGLVPPDYDLTIEDPPELHAERLQEPVFAGELEKIQYNMEKLSPEEYQIVEKYQPRIAPLILEEKPELIKETEAMGEGREAQKQALRRFMEIGEDGYDPIFQQRVMDAQNRAQAEAQSRTASIQQDFERRGLAGSGLELAGKIGAASQAMDRNAQMQLAAEAEAYRNQLQALSQGADLGGRIRAEDIGLQQQNLDIINSFNQRMSKRHQDWEQMRADAMNRADLRNIQEAQRLADMNVTGRNEAKVLDRERADRIALQDYENRYRERARQDQLARDEYDRLVQQRSYDDAREILRAKWRQGNTDWLNRWKEQGYQDTQDKMAGMAGVVRERRGDIAGSAAADNAAIQGFSNVLAQGLASSADRKYRREEAEKDRQAYGYGRSNIYG